MKKIVLIVVIALILAILVLGCGYPGYTVRFPLPRLRVYTNIPLYDTAVKLVNSTPYWFEVSWDERRLLEMLGPTEDVVVGFYHGQHAIVIKAWTAKGPEGKYVGATSREYSVSGYQQETKVWIVRDSDFRR